MRALENLDNVLYELCRHSCNLMDSWVPYSCNTIAENLNISKYAARKCIKELRERGLVEKDSIIPDHEYCSLPYNGFCVTEMAKKTDTFKRAAKDEAKICAEIFGDTEDMWYNVFIK